jgi:hypothetical protein
MIRMMIIAVGVVIGIWSMTPFVAQAQELEPMLPRCPHVLNLVAVTGKVVDVYAPHVVSAETMEVRFIVSGSHPKCDCRSFSYQSNAEEVRGVYAALLTALNNCKLVVTFCGTSGAKGDWCRISNLSIHPE